MRPRLAFGEKRSRSCPNSIDAKLVAEILILVPVWMIDSALDLRLPDFWLRRV